MAHKTKAAMPGRQCSTENREQNQQTRPVAGGQSQYLDYSGFCSLVMFYPFGSMPRDCSSFLRIRFIQVASDESPSLRISSSSCARNSSFNRIGNCGERFSGIDMVYAIGDIVRVYTSVYANDMKAQRPVVLGTHTGRLTTNR